jgi:phenylpyruvate tautomerase PptA (4-oxalocrotonate tautomerase family)
MLQSPAVPILDVEVVGAREEGLARRIADAAGAVFGTPPGRTWVKVRFLPRRDYAENGAALPHDVRPVLVRVLKADAPEDLAAEVRALTAAVAAAAGRPPENVHLLYEPWGRGRVAFGGNLVGA